PSTVSRRMRERKSRSLYEAAGCGACEATDAIAIKIRPHVVRSFRITRCPCTLHYVRCRKAGGVFTSDAAPSDVRLTLYDFRVPLAVFTAHFGTCSRNLANFNRMAGQPTKNGAGEVFVNTTVC